MDRYTYASIFTTHEHLWYMSLTRPVIAVTFHMLHGHFACCHVHHLKRNIIVLEQLLYGILMAFYLYVQHFSIQLKEMNVSRRPR